MHDFPNRERDAVNVRKVIYSLGDVKRPFCAKRLTYTKDPIHVFRAFLVETSGPQRKSPGFEFFWRPLLRIPLRITLSYEGMAVLNSVGLIFVFFL